MRLHRTVLQALAAVTIASPLFAQNPPAAGAPPQTGAPGEAGTQQATPPAARRAPRPYAQVITARAHTERGALTSHKVDDRYFFEVADSIMPRDWLLVSRLSGVPAGSG